MSETLFLPAMQDDGETEVIVEITVHSWGSPAQTYGPPESCDPGDPIEAEITDCWLAGRFGGRSETRIVLTDAERERIEAAFHESPPEPERDYLDEESERAWQETREGMNK